MDEILVDTGNRYRVVTVSDGIVTAVGETSMPAEHHIVSDTAQVGDSFDGSIFSQPLNKLKAELCAQSDDAIAAIYLQFTRFQKEYEQREIAARAYKLTFSGDPGPWVTSFAQAAGLDNHTATDQIIAKADGLMLALQTLGALRMQKYDILRATTAENAQAAYNNIINGAQAVSSRLS